MGLFMHYETRQTHFSGFNGFLGAEQTVEIETVQFPHRSSGTPLKWGVNERSPASALIQRCARQRVRDDFRLSLAINLLTAVAICRDSFGSRLTVFRCAGSRRTLRGTSVAAP